MKITASISEYINDTSNIPVHSEFELTAIPISGNILSVREDQYMVCQSLFSDKNSYMYDYYFEQILIPHTSSPDSIIPSKYLLLEGQIKFDDWEKTNLFKDILVKRNDGDLNVSLLYSYIRDSDCVRINNTVYRVVNIRIGESIEIRYSTINHPVHIDDFRKNSIKYCRKMIAH